MTDDQIKQLWEDLKDICNIESMDTGRANTIGHIFGELSETIETQRKALEEVLVLSKHDGESDYLDKCYVVARSVLEHNT
jgi:HEPN domain-containing protein